MKVEEERVYANTTAVLDSTPDFLLTLVENRDLGDRARKQLQAVVDLKVHLAEVESKLDVTKNQTTELTDDQTRLRQNIDSLNRVKGQEDQVRKYSAQLADNESELAKLRDQKRDLSERKTGSDSDLRALIDKLDF
ncbi:MAG: hypothetical protein WB992_05090 [Bryobacteraceae bacterium]